jgi:hypothetical protein
MSGDMNTALGNCVLMICMMAAAMKEMGINPSEWRMADDGEDWCIMVEEERAKLVQARLPEIFLGYGHDLKVEGVARTLEKVVLCGASPIRVGGKRVMVTKPGRAIGKSRVMVKVYSKRFLPAYVATVGQCMLAVNSGVPVLQAHAMALRRANDKLLRYLPGSYLYRLAGIDVDDARACPVTLEARLDFAVSFGVGVTTQLELEAWFDAVSPEELLRWAPPREVPGDKYAE